MEGTRISATQCAWNSAGVSADRSYLAKNSEVMCFLQILELVPASSSLLMPILARALPNKVLPTSMQCSYLRALLAVAELPRAAALRDNILAALVQHLVALDVEIRWQDISFSLGAFCCAHIAPCPLSLSVY